MSSDEEDDLLVALTLFDGKLVREQRPGSRYASLEEGRFSIDYELDEAERRESLAAVSKLLKLDRPPRELLDRLAAAFAPDGEHAGPVKATVKLRGQNYEGLQIHAAQLLLEVQVRRSLGLTLERAFQEVDEKHGYAGGAAKAMWESPKWRELRERIRQNFHPGKGRP